MKAKIDLDKFVRSLVERYYEKIHIDPTTTKCWLDSVLEDQGLEYKDGEIVEIDTIDTSSPRWAEVVKECKHDALEQAKKFNKERLFEVAKQETPEEKAEAEERKKTRKWLNFENIHEGTTITIPKNIKGTDTDGGVVGEKGKQGEQPTNKNSKERYKIISAYDWFKETHKDISIGEKQSTEEDSHETKAIKEQIENLKKRIEDNQLGCIVQRLDKIIELLQSAMLVLPQETYIPPIICKRPLDTDLNAPGGWGTNALLYGADYDIDTDKIKQDETNKSKS